MQQHYCGFFIDAEDIALGICPGCLNNLVDTHHSLNNFTLEELSNLLCPGIEIMASSTNNYQERIIINKMPEEILMDLNPLTGAYEVQTV
ncbi:MAG: hypothetical protein PUP93_28610 [Rhizonema sp. NSF051]|nr:hypothetical protein [Rhizonema sp. NSF051]